MTEAAANERGVRKERTGIVVSDRMAKTIIVRVERKKPHPLYGKVIRDLKKFYAHDEERQAKMGDTVRIVETRPLSKLKRWRLLTVVARSKG